MIGRLIKLFCVARAFSDLCNLNWTVQLTHRARGQEPSGLSQIRQDVEPPLLVVTLRACRKLKGLGAGRHLRDKHLGGLLYIRLSRFPNLDREPFWETPENLVGNH